MFYFKKTWLFIIVFHYLGMTAISAQSAPPVHIGVNTNDLIINPYANPVILKHYTVADLQQMETSDSIKFKTISYYYTQSFIIEEIASCDGCKSYDPNTFDVFDFERFRKKSERYQRVWTKYGFKLTLLSIDELQYKLPIHNAP